MVKEVCKHCVSITPPENGLTTGGYWNTHNEIVPWRDQDEKNWKKGQVCCPYNGVVIHLMFGPHPRCLFKDLHEGKEVILVSKEAPVV